MLRTWNENLEMGLIASCKFNKFPNFMRRLKNRLKNRCVYRVLSHFAFFTLLQQWWIELSSTIITEPSRAIQSLFLVNNSHYTYGLKPPLKSLTGHSAPVRALNWECLFYYAKFLSYGGLALRSRYSGIFSSLAVVIPKSTFSRT